MQSSISIRQMASISPLGAATGEIFENYQRPETCLELTEIGEASVYAGCIPKNIHSEIERIKSENTNYRHLDDSVLYAMYAARRLGTGLIEDTSEVGINIGSSRGATGLFEQYYDTFVSGGRISPYASPSTTLGNISSWVSQDLGAGEAVFSHSVTCSTSLHALVNAAAWLQAGFCKQFIAGGAEAPLTPFTIAQMQALKTYAPSAETMYPCRAADPSKSGNTLVLGEGAALFLLEKGLSADRLASIVGIGYASEKITHGTSISENGENLQRAMKMALAGHARPDVVVMHTPGTVKGDQSEWNAIREIFKDECPAVTTNKWKIGHAFGASGALSVEMAILMLRHQRFFGVPYLPEQRAPKQIKSVLVNAAGFGGNAASLLLE